MLNVVLYFQVHQPFRLRPLTVFDIARRLAPFDEELNRGVLKKVARNCYLPANEVLGRLIDRHGRDFRVSFSITGSALDQFGLYAPRVLESFQRLAASGCVELIGETYDHSLSCLYDPLEFAAQVFRHRETIHRLFGVLPRVFRNTELVYADDLLEKLDPALGYDVILVEGADRLLNGRSPLSPRLAADGRRRLLLRHYRLSDDIAFRFSNRTWETHPLSAETYLGWLKVLGEGASAGGVPGEQGPAEPQGFLNLFLDYETFGEHQSRESGIFRFLERLVDGIIGEPSLRFAWPSEVLAVRQRLEPFCTSEPLSWADEARDLGAWTGNDLQQDAAQALYRLLARARTASRPGPIAVLRRLTTSDHLYYMSTRGGSDGGVHRYFSPYPSPEEAYRRFMLALAGVEERLGRAAR